MQAHVYEIRRCVQRKGGGCGQRNRNEPHPYAVVKRGIHGIASRPAQSHNKKHIECVYRVHTHEDPQHDLRLRYNVRFDIEQGGKRKRKREQERSYKHSQNGHKPRASVRVLPRFAFGSFAYFFADDYSRTVPDPDKKHPRELRNRSRYIECGDCIGARVRKNRVFCRNADAPQRFVYNDGKGDPHKARKKIACKRKKLGKIPACFVLHPVCPTDRNDQFDKAGKHRRDCGAFYAHCGNDQGRAEKRNACTEDKQIIKKSIHANRHGGTHRRQFDVLGCAESKLKRKTDGKHRITRRDKAQVLAAQFYDALVRRIQPDKFAREKQRGAHKNKGKYDGKRKRNSERTPYAGNVFFAPKLRDENRAAARNAEQYHVQNKKDLIAQSRRGDFGCSEAADHYRVEHVDKCLEKVL